MPFLLSILGPRIRASLVSTKLGITVATPCACCGSTEPSPVQLPVSGAWSCDQSDSPAPSAPTLIVGPGTALVLGLESGVAWFGDPASSLVRLGLTAGPDLPKRV